MRARVLGGTGVEVTEYGFGAASLGNLYRAIDDEPAGDRFLELWEIVRGAEDDLRARAAQRSAADVEAAEVDADIVDASEDAD